MTDPIPLKQPTPSLASRVGTSLYHRLWVSRGWTVLGIVGAGLVEVFNETVLPTLLGSPSPYLHGLAVLIATYGASKLSPAAVQAWAAKKQAEQDAAEAAAKQPQGGFGTVGLLVLIAAVLGAAALLPVKALGDDPKFGGCLASHADTCFAPSVSVNLVSIRLSDGTLTSTFDPGLGYGVTFFSSKWYTAGISLTAAIPTIDGARRVQPALTGSFAQYARIGYACPLYTAGGCGKNGQVTFGFGSDFGAAAK